MKATKIAGGWKVTTVPGGWRLVGGRGTLPIALPASFYGTTAAAVKEARRLVARATKRNPGKTAKAVRLTNFTGTITKLPNGQVRVAGRVKR